MAVDIIMPLRIPEVGEWYVDPNGNRFEVVALDEDDRSIEIQHFDGTVEEFDFVAWEGSDFRLTGPPEDYSGSLDIEREDLDTDLNRPASEKTADPLEYLDKSK